MSDNQNQQASSIIINHHQSSSIIINHHQSSSIIDLPLSTELTIDGDSISICGDLGSSTTTYITDGTGHLVYADGSINVIYNIYKTSSNEELESMIKEAKAELASRSDLGKLIL